MNVGGAAATDGSAGASSDTWTLLRLMKWSGSYLEEKGIEGGRHDAEHLLAHVLEMERLQLYLEFDRPLIPAELDRFRPLLRRRARREPLQYILGHAAFREIEVAVDPAVLIPRPETETLVEEVLEWASGRGREGLSGLDIGTGSGAIALSLVFEGGFDRVVATDFSAAALEVARRNAESLGLEGAIDFRSGSLFDPVLGEERFDAIVSNPPYVAEIDAEGLQPEVRDWEPGSALFAGPDGLSVLRAIVQGAGRHLVSEGLLALEVGLGQTGPVVGLLEDTGDYSEVRVRRDLAGRERVVLAFRASTN